MEFVAKKKMMKVTIEGQSYEMRCPCIGETDELTEKLEALEGKSKGALSVYYNFFAGLGLPVEASKKMDTDDFMKFISFVLSPKKNSPTETL